MISIEITPAAGKDSWFQPPCFIQRKDNLKDVVFVDYIEETVSSVVKTHYRAFDLGKQNLKWLTTDRSYIERAFQPFKGTITIKVD